MAAEPEYNVDFAPTAFADPVLAACFDYWRKKRGDRPMPTRADIRPAELKVYLPSIVLSDALPEYNDFRFRLIGTRVTQYFLGDATGKTLRETHLEAGVPPEATENLLGLMRTVCEAKTWLRLTAPSGEWRGHFYPAFESLYLPISDDGESAKLILNAFNFDYARLRASRANLGSPI